MSELTPEQLSPEELLQQQLLGTIQGESHAQEGIVERMTNLFSSNDFVKIQNPFDRLAGWVCVDPDEEVESRPNDMERHVFYGKPKTRILQPNEEIVIKGWEAYIGVERLFKEYAQLSGQGISSILLSDTEITKFLDKVFKGVFNPADYVGKPAPKGADEAKEVVNADDDAVLDSLGFADDKPKRGRPKKS